MTGKCKYCGGTWSTDSRSLSFRACCPRIRDVLEADAEDAADAKAEHERERREEGDRCYED